MTARKLATVTMAVVGVLLGTNVAHADAYLSKQSARSRAHSSVVLKAWRDGAEEYTLERASRCTRKRANVVQCDYTMWFAIEPIPKFPDVSTDYSGLSDALKNLCQRFRGVVRVKRHPLDGYLTVSFPGEERCAE